jgi:hypothetical protein
MSAIVTALDNLARLYDEQHVAINRLQTVRTTIIVNARHMGYSQEEAEAMADGTSELTFLAALTKSCEDQKRFHQAEAEAKMKAAQEALAKIMNEKMHAPRPSQIAKAARENLMAEAGKKWPGDYAQLCRMNWFGEALQGAVVNAIMEAQP